MALNFGTVPRNSLTGDFTLGLTGDLIYLRPMSQTLEAQQPELVESLRRSDALIGNLETVLLELDSFAGSPQAQSGGTWMLADPLVARDLQQLGFSMLGLANNHATDWGVEGLLQTRRFLDEVGLLHAGAGRTLSQARAPSYQDLPQGRVAFLSASATFTSMSPAEDPFGQVPGRPGINVLRTREYSAVNPADYGTLQGFARQRSLNNSVRTDSLKLMGGEFVADPEVSQSTAQVRYRVDPHDEQQILTQIRQARQNSNLVVLGFHCHQPANEEITPAQFAVEFSRRAVEAGADVVVCHGPHQLRGIEIYQGAPIFHSLGNFAMMTNSLDAVTAATYELYDAAPETVTVPELLTARNEAVFGDPNMQESVLPLLRYQDGELNEVELIPLDIAPGPGARLGTPSQAESGQAGRQLERLQELSEPFGTVLRIAGDRAFINLS